MTLRTFITLSPLKKQEAKISLLLENQPIKLQKDSHRSWEEKFHDF